MSYSFSQVVLTYFINMLGNEALATRTYVVNIVMFVYLFAIAMAQGGAICIGHLVGERKIHAAYLLGKYVMRISILVSLVLSCIWALMGHTLFSWLTDNPEIIRLGTIILFIDVILEVGRAINIYATNALRATGDVNYPFYVGFVVQWSVAVGCGFLFGIHWGWGLVGMWCAFVLDENLRGIDKCDGCYECNSDNRCYTSIFQCGWYIFCFPACRAWNGIKCGQVCKGTQIL